MSSPPTGSPIDDAAVTPAPGTVFDGGAGRPEPVPTPDTAPYWEAAARGELLLPRCDSCTRPHFYPRPVCPLCGNTDLTWTAMSGHATLHSYVLSHRRAPGFTTPIVIAVVELAEGPRLMSNVVGVDPDPEKLELDMALRVAFERRDTVTVPVFVPAVTS